MITLHDIVALTCLVSFQTVAGHRSGDLLAGPYNNPVCVKIPECDGHLYLGNVTFAKNNKKLQRKSFTHVLSVLTRSSDLYPEQPDGFATEEEKPHPSELLEDDVTVRLIELRDATDADIEEHFEDAIDFIDEAIESDGKILVHCRQGVSRSVTMIIAYLVKKHGYTIETALELIRSVRGSVAGPNKGFRQQLEEFEAPILKKRAEKKRRDKKKKEQRRRAEKERRRAEKEERRAKKKEERRIKKHNQKAALERRNLIIRFIGGFLVTGVLTLAVRYYYPDQWSSSWTYLENLFEWDSDFSEPDTDEDGDWSDYEYDANDFNEDELF